MLHYRAMSKRLAFILVACAVAALVAAAAPPKQPSKDRTIPPWRKMSYSDLRIQVEQSTEKMEYEQVVIYGNGVAVWNDKAQFRIKDEDLGKILTALDKAGFDKLKSVPEGEHLRRRVRVRAGDYEHEVAETWEVEQERKEGKKEAEEEKPSVKKQSGEKKKTEAEEQKKQEAGFRDAAKLETLVDTVLKLVQPPVPEKLITADSLGDGLKKIAAGELAPETMTLMMMAKPDSTTTGAGPVDGFLMRIDGGVASSSEYLGDKNGFSPPVRRILDAKTLREIASKLVENDFEGLPANLFAERYVELNVRVLNYRRGLTARRFAGMTPEKLGAAQKRFDTVSVWLHGQQRHWFAYSSKE